MFAAAIVTVTFMNVIGASIAFGVNLWASIRLPGKIRWMFQAIASLALVYCVAYFWLLFNPDKVEVWSDFLRPLSILTWVVAWAIEPVLIVREFERRAKEIISQVEHFAERTERLHRR